MFPFGATHMQSGHTARNEICGPNLDWNFNNETNTLSISGQGYMTCCNMNYTP